MLRYSYKMDRASSRNQQKKKRGELLHLIFKWVDLATSLTLLVVAMSNLGNAWAVIFCTFYSVFEFL